MYSQSDKLSRDVTEIDQIIEFNLGAALELLSNEDLAVDQGGAFTVVTEGLERARNQLANLIEESQHIHIACRDNLTRISQTTGLQLLELTNNEKVVELQIRITRAKLKDKVISARQQFVLWLKSIWPKLVKGSQQFYNTLLENYRRFRKDYRSDHFHPDLDRHPLVSFSETRKQIDALPFVYQRLFRFEPTTTLFIGRERELKIIQDNFASF